MKNEDLVLLKVPQIIIARKLRRGPQKGEKCWGTFVQKLPNETNGNNCLLEH